MVVEDPASLYCVTRLLFSPTPLLTWFPCWLPASLPGMMVLGGQVCPSTQPHPWLTVGSAATWGRVHEECILSLDLLCVGHMFFSLLVWPQVAGGNVTPEPARGLLRRRMEETEPQVSACLLQSPLPFSQRQRSHSVAWDGSQEALGPLQPLPQACCCSGLVLVMAQTRVPGAFEDPCDRVPSGPGCSLQGERPLLLEYKQNTSF